MTYIRLVCSIAEPLEKQTKLKEPLILTSPRLRLINATPATLEQILAGDEALARHLDIAIADPWSEFGHAPFDYVLKHIHDTPEESIWWSWLPVLKEENKLVGNCGYKGPPKEGVVEIGYEVARDYRNMGLATEIAQTLIQHAFSYPDVTTILAHTLAEENASVRILKKCGFAFKGIVEDPEDGIIWKWSLQKE